VEFANLVVTHHMALVNIPDFVLPPALVYFVATKVMCGICLGHFSHVGTKRNMVAWSHGSALHKMWHHF